MTRVYRTMRSKNQGNPDIEVLHGERKGNLHLHIQSKYEPLTPASVVHASLTEQGKICVFVADHKVATLVRPVGPYICLILGLVPG